MWKSSRVLLLVYMFVSYHFTTTRSGSRELVTARCFRDRTSCSETIHVKQLTRAHLSVSGETWQKTKDDRSGSIFAAGEIRKTYVTGRYYTNGIQFENAFSYVLWPVHSYVKIVDWSRVRKETHIYLVRRNFAFFCCHSFRHKNRYDNIISPSITVLFCRDTTTRVTENNKFTSFFLRETSRNDEKPARQFVSND